MSDRNPLSAGLSDPALTLEKAFARVALDPQSDGDRLRLDVCDYVDAMKRDGWTPEHVIVSIKQIANRAGILPPSYQQASSQRLDEREGVLGRAVRWCIERYYDDGDGRK